MNRRRIGLLLIITLLLLLAGDGMLWLRTQQRQSALNHQLFAALADDNDIKKALALMEAGADPNCRYTPPAPSLKQLVIQLLHPAPPVKSSPTAFMLVCGERWDASNFDLQYDATLAQAMLEHGAYVNTRGEFGWTPLMMAVQFDDLEMVRVLLAHGANVNAQDEDRWTALRYAVRDTSNKAIIRQLMAHGADPNLADKYGYTPYWIAEHFKRTDVVALLKQAGARK